MGLLHDMADYCSDHRINDMFEMMKCNIQGTCNAQLQNVDLTTNKIKSPIYVKQCAQYS